MKCDLRYTLFHENLFEKKIVCRWRPFCPGLTFGHGFVHTGAFMDAVLENKDIWLILMWYLGPNSWWRHQMETISVLLALCAGNSPVSGESPSQTPVTVVFSLICAWTNGWVNNRNAGDLRRHCSHYDITVMRIHIVRIRKETNNVRYLLYKFNNHKQDQFNVHTRCAHSNVDIYVYISPIHISSGAVKWPGWVIAYNYLFMQ